MVRPLSVSVAAVMFILYVCSTRLVVPGVTLAAAGLVLEIAITGVAPIALLVTLILVTTFSGRAPVTAPV